MPKKVIHLRLDTETLVSVDDFFFSRGGQRDVPTSTRVSRVLATLTLHLRQSGQLPLHQHEDLEDLLNANLPQSTLSGPIDLSGLGQTNLAEETSNPGERRPTATEQNIVTDASAHGLTKILHEASPEDDARTAMRSAIKDSVDAVTQPDPVLDPDVWQPDPEALPEQGEFTLDIEAQPKIALADLPVDDPRVIEAMACEGIEQDVKLMLLRIAYKLVEDQVFNADNTLDDELFESLQTSLTPHLVRYFEEKELSS